MMIMFICRFMKTRTRCVERFVPLFRSLECGGQGGDIKRLDDLLDQDDSPYAIYWLGSEERQAEKPSTR